MTFYVIVDIDCTVQLEHASAVADARWLRLGALPSQAELAHQGWAPNVIQELATMPAGVSVSV